MTIKEKLMQEISEVPEDIAVQLLSLLHLLKDQDRTSAMATDPEGSPFICIDGFFVIRPEKPLPNIDWVSLVREERMNNLMKDESII